MTGLEHSGGVDEEECGKVDQTGFRWQSVERFCWISTILAPLVYWLQGPAVSTDQRVMRWSVFCLLLACALCLRWRSRRTRAARQ